MTSDSFIKNVEPNTDYIIVSTYISTVCTAGFFLNAFALYKVRKVSNNNKKISMILTNLYKNTKVVSKINNCVNKKITGIQFNTELRFTKSRSQRAFNVNLWSFSRDAHPNYDWIYARRSIMLLQCCNLHVLR